MQTAPPVLSVLLIILCCSGWVSGLCYLMNGTMAKCHELEDVKYIETYDLESLRASVMHRHLTSSIFDNLASLKHLDLSGGDLEHVDPGCFRKLTNLRSLDLADNRIGYLELAALDGLNHLRSLNLRKNKLRQLPPALARLKILRHLDVQGNPLECNCATLRVRDLIVKRGVKISKKIVCVGPSNMKGTSLLSPDATRICNLEEQDREMQKDQPYEGSAEGEDDPLDHFNEDEEEEVKDHSVSEAPKEEEVETPYPDSSVASTTSSTTVAAIDSTTAQDVTHDSMQTVSTTGVSDSIEKETHDDDEIVFDSEDNKDETSTMGRITEKTVVKDSLFYPVEGSGDDEGSGEGSGTGLLFPEQYPETASHEEKSPPPEDSSFIDMLFGAFWSTTSNPDETKEPDLEEEQFIDASSTKEAEEESVVTKKNELVGSAVGSTTVEVTTKDSLFDPTSGIEVVDEKAVQDTSKLGNVKLTDETVNDELSGISPAKQSKKGMGSYVVLAALLAILAALIGFAAYKGDFCRKKRKRGDVENGTEMKDMQKALLDGSNAAQPKIASNGNAESVPLVEGTPEQDDKDRIGHLDTMDSSQKAANGTADHADPIKPPRRAVSSHDSLKDDSLSARTNSMDPVGSAIPPSNGPASPRLPEVSAPPLSPGAQRVKITLQENPDSVPKTPILITRTMAGENLVKTTP